MDTERQTIESLNAEFGMPGVLRFTTRGELVCAEITTPSATASITLHGAHLLSWQPSGSRPVLFLSERSEFAAAKAIRGGVPIIWPWFGPRSEAVPPPPPDAPRSPSHGFARTAEWRLQFAALAGDDLHLTFTLGPSEESRSFGFDGFRLAFEVVVGRNLTLRLTVANDGPAELRFEEALHSYFAVGAIEQTSLLGLAATEYLDKPDGMKRKLGNDPVLRFSGTTDRVYLATASTCRIQDEALARETEIGKSNSRNTVVWNPWAEVTAGLADMDPEGWHGMLCVETANVGAEAIRLAPGEAHTMEVRIVVAQNQGTAERIGT